LRSDDPDDLTLREARWLGVADVVVAVPGVPPAILARARADAARLSPQDPIPSTGIVVRLRR
jgi:uroporphyrin-III C-methyltransferase/precorrin-2 dehydrogenase/sirohydrochlorin ferrochelatase